MDALYVGLSERAKKWLQDNGNHLSIDTYIINPRLNSKEHKVDVRLEQAESRYEYETFAGTVPLDAYVLKDGRVVYERVQEELFKESNRLVFTYLCWDDGSPVEVTRYTNRELSRSA